MHRIYAKKQQLSRKSTDCVSLYVYLHLKKWEDICKIYIYQNGWTVSDGFAPFAHLFSNYLQSKNQDDFNVKKLVIL